MLLQNLKNNYTGFFDGIDNKNNVVTLIKNHSETRPESIALQWPVNNNTIKWDGRIIENIQHNKINYKDFFDIISRTASGLLETGINHKDCVILFLPMSLYLYQVMAAIMMIGGRCVFLDSWARREQLGISASIVKPKAMISFEKAFEFCKGVPELENIPVKIIVGPRKNKYNAEIEELQKKNKLDTIKAVESEETALITFTTGSSGVPKGADRTHQFLSSQHLALKECLPYNNNDIDLPAFPIFSLNNLASGVNTVIPIIDIANPTDRDPIMIASQIASTGINCATLSPSMITNIAKYFDKAKIQLRNIKRIITGGAPLSNDILELFKKSVPGSEIWVLYGSTEVEPIAHIEVNEILSTKKSKSISGVKVGKIVEGLEYKLIKINKNPVQLTGDNWKDKVVINDEAGELIVAGLHVCKSYYNDKTAVERAKIIESNGKVWHRTGDIAVIDDEENIWLVARVHNIIIRNNIPLFPVNAEIILKKNIHVTQAAYIGIPDDKLGEKTYALVVIEKNSNEIKVLDEISKLLKSNGIIYDYLGAIENIPLDPRHHSKVEYDVLRKIIIEKRIGF